MIGESLARPGQVVGVLGDLRMRNRDLAHHGAGALEHLDAFEHRCLDLGVELRRIEEVRAWYANPEALDVASQPGDVVRDRLVRGSRIARIVAGDYIEEGRAVPGGAGHRTDAVQAIAERHAPELGYPPEAHLEPSMSVGRRRRSHRSTGVCPQSAEDQPGGHGDACARAGSRGGVLGIPGVPGHGEPVVRVRSAASELTGDGLAHDDRAGGAQPLDDWCVPQRSPGPIENVAVGSRRGVAGRDDVLDTEWNPLQRALIESAVKVRIRLLSRRQGALAGDGDERAETRIEMLDAVEHASCQLNAGDLSVAQGRGGGFDGERKVGHVASVHSASKISAGSS